MQAAQLRNFSERETLKLGMKLLEALESLHKNGYIHGEMEPSNIMYKDETPYLIDYKNSE